MASNATEPQPGTAPEAAGTGVPSGTVATGPAPSAPAATGPEAAGTGSAPRARRPLIGLPTYFRRAAFGVWNRESAVLPSSYTAAVTRAGGRPVLLSPDTPWSPEEVAELDGIVLTGGDDVDPALYGATPHPRTFPPNLRRDAFETGLYAAAREAGIPVLAICRGAQIVNTVHGGTLLQHLPDVSSYGPHEDAVADAFATVTVTLEPGTATAELLGEAVSVRCHHHQGVDRLGEGLRVTGRAEDGCIEAFEILGQPVPAVQWHPEETPEDLRLFTALVSAAAERAAAHRGASRAAVSPTASAADTTAHRGASRPAPSPTGPTAREQAHRVPASQEVAR